MYPCILGGVCFTLGSYLAWAAAERTYHIPLQHSMDSPASLSHASYLLVRVVAIFRCSIMCEACLQSAACCLHPK